MRLGLRTASGWTLSQQTKAAKESTKPLTMAPVASNPAAFPPCPIRLPKKTMSTNEASGRSQARPERRK